MANRFELLLPDVAGAFHQGRAQVRQENRERFADQELRAQTDRGNRLRDLAGQAHAEQDPAIRQQLMSRAYDADPQGAMKLEEQFASNEQRKEELKSNTARLLMSLPQEARPAQYMKMRQTFLQAGMEAPPEYTPQMDQVMKAYAAQQQKGAGVQSTVIGKDGQYYTVDRATGRMTPTGVIADPRIQIMEQPGQAPYGLVTSRGPAGQIVPLGGGQPGTQPPMQPQSAPPPMQQPPPQGGGPQGPSTPPPPGAGIPPTNPGMPSPPAAGPVRIPTPAETAAETARAKAGVELQTAPEIARRTAEATQQGKTQAELQETKRKNQTAYNVYSTARDNLQKAMAGTLTGPLVGRFPAFTSGRQIAEGARAAAAPILKDLFRESGEGVFTNADQELLLAMLPNVTDDETVVPVKLQMVDDLVAAKLGMPKRGGASLGAPPNAAPATRSLNGKTYVQQNGQWFEQE